MRPESRLGTSNYRFSDEDKTFVATVLNCAAHEVLPGGDSLAIDRGHGRGAGDGCSTTTHAVKLGGKERGNLGEVKAGPKKMLY